MFSEVNLHEKLQDYKETPRCWVARENAHTIVPL